MFTILSHNRFPEVEFIRSEVIDPCPKMPESNHEERVDKLKLKDILIPQPVFQKRRRCHERVGKAEELVLIRRDHREREREQVR